MPKQKPRLTIRVGQRLIRWDGAKGHVSLNTKGVRVHGPEDAFLVEWLDWDGTVESAEYYTLITLVTEGVTFGRGVMPWAK